MRYHGTIIRWDYELGFGFIREEQSTAEIFAHIGEFETENPPPRDGETVSFDIVSNSRGSEEATNIEYTNRSRKPSAEQFEFDDEAPKNLPHWLAVMAIAIIGIPALSAAVYYGLDYWQTHRKENKAVNEVVVDRVAAEMMAERKAWREAVEAAGKNSPSVITLPDGKAGYKRSSYNGKQSLQSFRCDGRQYCSQMASYEEAEFFLSHCPNVKMDGDNDGIPCEDQFSR